MLRGLVYKELYKALLLYAKKQRMKQMMGEVDNNNNYAGEQYAAIGFKNKERASDHSKYVIGDIDEVLRKLGE